MSASRYTRSPCRSQDMAGCHLLFASDKVSSFPAEHTQDRHGSRSLSCVAKPSCVTQSETRRRSRAIPVVRIYKLRSISAKYISASLTTVLASTHIHNGVKREAGDLCDRNSPVASRTLTQVASIEAWVGLQLASTVLMATYRCSHFSRPLLYSRCQQGAQRWTVDSLSQWKLHLAA